MIYHKAFSFLENPATEEEKSIAEIIEKYLVSLQNRDYSILTSLFEKEASIHSLAAGNKIVLRDQFVRALQESKPFLFAAICLGELRIRVISANTASVSGYHQYAIAGRKSKIQILEMKLRKNENEWHITELYYHPC